jgi:hypothetical protein
VDRGDFDGAYADDLVELLDDAVGRRRIGV